MGHELSEVTTNAIQAEISSVAAGAFTSRSSPGVSASGICFSSSGDQFDGVLGTVFSSVQHRYSAYFRFVLYESVSSPSTITYWFNSNWSWVYPATESRTELTCDSELDDLATEPGYASTSRWLGCVKFRIGRFCTEQTFFNRWASSQTSTRGCQQIPCFQCIAFDFQMLMDSDPCSAHYPDPGRRHVCPGIKAYI